MTSPPAPPLDRSQPPRLGAAKSFRFPNVVRGEVAPGLELLALPVRELPIVHLRLVLVSGGDRAPADLPGLPSLTAGLLDEGTKTRSSQELATAAEKLGGYVASGAGWDASAIETELLRDDLATGLELIADIASNPTFPEKELARVRRQCLAEIARRQAQPSAVADLGFAQLLYQGTVYEHPLIGTETSLGAIDRQRVVDFYRHSMATSRAVLLAVGDFDLERLTALAAATFPTRAGGAPPAPKVEPRSSQSPGPWVQLLDRPDAAQTEIRVGQVGISRLDDRFIPASVTSCLLGGKFTSRLNLNLREEKGLTYGVRSHFAKRIGPGPFVVSTAVDNENVGIATREILGEIDRLRESAPSGDELTDTANYLIGSFPYAVETVRGMADRLRDIAVFDLPANYYSDYGDRIRAVGADEVLETASDLLPPENMVVVCVGPAGELRSQFESDFPVRIATADPA